MIAKLTPCTPKSPLSLSATLKSVRYLPMAAPSEMVMKVRGFINVGVWSLKFRTVMLISKSPGVRENLVPNWLTRGKQDSLVRAGSPPSDARTVSVCQVLVSKFSSEVVLTTPVSAVEKQLCILQYQYPQSQLRRNSCVLCGGLGVGLQGIIFLQHILFSWIEGYRLNWHHLSASVEATHS